MSNENGHVNPNPAGGGINNAGQMGVTLVEMVVAAFILIASLTVLLVTFSRVQHNAETAHRELNALHIARTEMEQFRSTNFSAITTYSPINLSDAFFVPLGGQKQCTVISNVNGYKEISLTVSWRSAEGTPTISQTFYTIICNTN